MRTFSTIALPLVLGCIAAAVGATALGLPLWVVLAGWVAFLASADRTSAAPTIAGSWIAGVLLAFFARMILEAPWGSSQDHYLLAGGVLVVAGCLIAQHFPVRSGVLSYASGALASLGAGVASINGAMLLLLGTLVGLAIGLLHVKTLDRALRHRRPDTA